MLEHSEKWRFRVQEAPTKKRVFVTLDDEEDGDEPNGRNKGSLVRKKEKAKKKAEVASLGEKIDETMKSYQTMVAQ